MAKVEPATDERIAKIKIILSDGLGLSNEGVIPLLARIDAQAAEIEALKEMVFQEGANAKVLKSACAFAEQERDQANAMIGELRAAIMESIARADDCGDSYNSLPIRMTLSRTPQEAATRLNALEAIAVAAKEEADNSCAFDCRLEGQHPGCKIHAALKTLEDLKKGPLNES